MDGFIRRHKAMIAMVVLQIITASVTLFSKVALSQGLSPFVFVAYRQIFATIIMAPLAFISRWKSPEKYSFGSWSFFLILITSLIGVTANNNTYFEGLSLSSSTIATAMLNLIPAITFLLATVVGLEKINLRSLRGYAKVIGTVICIGGGICMALVKGRQLFETDTNSTSFLMLFNATENENLRLGCLFLFINCCCNSFWIVMQVPIAKACPDHLYTTFWMFMLSSIQSVICTLIIHRNKQIWLLKSSLQLASCVFAAMGEATSFFIQVWCISQTGPVFSVMFTPLSTLFATLIAVFVLHRTLYLGSLLGAVGVIFGLYVVLWGKAKDLKSVGDKRPCEDPEVADLTRRHHIHLPLLVES